MKKILALICFLISLNSFSQCTELYISEYIEGSGNNKAIEIYNPTMLPVNLTGYSLKLYSNGSAVPSASVNLTGTLNPFDVYIVAHPSANAGILAVANLTSGSVINYNGNDAVQLFSGAVAIDNIGIVGVDPGAGWSVNGVTNGTLNHTLRRKQAVQLGNLTWTASGELEWYVYPVDATWYLDMHVMNTCGSTLSGFGSGMGTCMDEPSVFASNGISGAGSYNYAWDFGDGTTFVTTQNTTHTFSTPGTYIISWVVTDASFNVYSESFTLTVSNAPIACVNTVMGDGCASDTVSFTNCSTGGTGASSYSWDFDNGNTSTVANPANEIYGAGNYTIQLIVVDMASCNDTLNIPFTVNTQEDASFSYSQTVYCSTDPNPVPTITGTSGGTFTCSGCTINASTGELDLALTTAGSYDIYYSTSGACNDAQMQTITVSSTIADATITASGPYCESGNPVTLNAATSGGVWTGTGIVDANLGTFDPSLAGTGTYTITYTISGTCGSSDTETFDVLADQNVVINTNDTTICNDSFGFFLSANSGGTWSGNNVSDMGNGSGFFSSAAITGGVYYAVYTLAGPCGDVDSVMVIVGETPTADFIYVINGNTVDFTDASTGAASHAWVIDENTEITNSLLTNFTYTYVDPNDTLYACLTIMSSLGCENLHCEYIYPPLSVEEDLLQLISLYPNPVTEQLTIGNLPLNSSLKISVRNPIGQEVFTIQSNGSTNKTLDLSNLVNGTYFITITIDDANMTRKFLKIK